jgi:hypothetical protein
MRIKKQEMDKQRLASEPTLLEKAMDLICASCNRDQSFKLMAKVNDRITYIDTMEANFRGLYGRAN